MSPKVSVQRGQQWLLLRQYVPYHTIIYKNTKIART